MTEGKWPAEVAGGGTPLDRARTIANALYRARHSVAEVERIVALAVRWGETWLVAHFVANQGDLLSRDEAAELAGVQPQTIRKWVQRGHIHYFPGGYSEREILDYLADRRDTPS